MAIRDAAAKAVHTLLNRPADVPPEEQAYRRLTGKGYRPSGIIDVGAYRGEWTRLAPRVFRDVPTLMVEAQGGKIPHLERVCSELAGVTYVNAALSSEPGKEVVFHEMETGSSLLHENSNVAAREVRMVTQTLDGIAAAVPAPLFLKIDVQGAELMVLAGATATLDRADLVQLEIAVLEYNRGAPTMREVLDYMDARGFAPYDLAGWSRPDGVHLVQIDLLFTRKDSSLRPRQFTF
ncbi:MAG: FkbM family methyltransferase [Novosphingobium sp.]|nr:FkbM family methyltransferase [Novosphingobium sp.]